MFCEVENERYHWSKCANGRETNVVEKKQMPTKDTVVSESWLSTLVLVVVVAEETTANESGEPDTATARPMYRPTVRSNPTCD